MNKLLRILLILGVVILLIIVLTLAVSRDPFNGPDINPIKERIGITASEIERTSNQDTTFLVSTNNDDSFSIRDFRNDLGVIVWGDAGTLVLGDGLINEDKAFQIFYYDLDQSFSIAILQEPISDIKKVAEAQLLERLQISRKDACNLIVSVTVPSFVSEEISGQNLGLSFCPEAIQL